MDTLKRNPIAATAGVIFLLVGAWFVFGFLEVQSAFLDTTVAEAGPTFGDPADEAAFDEAMDEAAENETTANDGEPPMDGEIQTIFTGNFADMVINGYNLTGQALVLTDGSEQRFLRLDENFSTPNGPDLKVYLRAENGDFISLGDLTGNIGSQNYEIPVDVDLSVYNFVDIWCERFSVGFGGAIITPTAA